MPLANSAQRCRAPWANWRRGARLTSILALGDTNYTHFCGFGKRLDARLAELGAKRILDRVDCDVRFDELAAQWQKGVFETLEIINSVGGEPPVDSFSAVVDGSKSSCPLHIEPGLDEPISKTTPVYTRTHPFAARLLVNRQLTGSGSAKDTRHYEISLEGSGITYEVGDALGIIPQNDPGLVSEILAALGFDGEEEVPGAKGDKISIRLALLRDYQIRAPHREFLNAMVEHDDADQYLKELVRSDTRTELDKFLWGREIIDFLLESPGVKFEPAEFVGLLKNLQPRLYSIASSIKAHPEQVHLTVDAVRYESHGRIRKGVCSNFLAERCGTETPLPIFIQTTKHFRLPEKGDLPIIMVGPGTGIAPFRGFLQERKVSGANGGNWLFFGAQKSECDFFYRDELEVMQREGGVLTRLDTAFSRDQDFKIYVQHRMIEHGAELWKWLEEGAHFYVCGDASRMAKDVDKALHQIIETNGGLTSEAAGEYVQKLKGQKRYQRDVY